MGNTKKTPLTPCSLTKKGLSKALMGWLREDEMVSSWKFREGKLILDIKLVKEEANADL